MDKEMLEHFSNTLNARLIEGFPSMRRKPYGLIDIETHNDPMDEVDQTSKRNEQEFIMYIQGRCGQHIREIHEALQRIKSGDFGICEECGDDIEIERLKVQPTTTLCFGCKKEMEMMKPRKVA